MKIEKTFRFQPDKFRNDEHHFFFFLRTYRTHWNNLPQLFNKNLREVERTFGIKGFDGIACLYKRVLLKRNRSSCPRFRVIRSLSYHIYVYVHGPDLNHP